MKRGGLGFIILVVFGGLLRFAVLPSSSSPSSSSLPQSQPTLAKATQINRKAEAKGTYLDRLGDRIKESFPTGDVNSRDEQDLADHLNVPRPVREHVRFVVAILPDPMRRKNKNDVARVERPVRKDQRRQASSEIL